jgi:hypothetical protein
VADENQEGPDVDEYELGGLLADRATLILRQVRDGMTPRVQRSLNEGAPWIRMDRWSARAVIAYFDKEKSRG